MKKTSLDSDYFLKFYLDSDPFPLVEPDSISYLTPELERRLERIAGLVENSEKLIVVTGAAGGGKSTMARQLAASLDSFWTIGSAMAGPSMDVEMLARALLRDVAPEEIKNVPQAVTGTYKFLEHCDRAQVSPVFIVDDAHELPTVSLEFLLQLFRQRYNKSRFRLILVAHETINDRLGEFPADVRPEAGIENVHLPSFSEQQASEYVLYRLTACGLNRDSPITETDISYIHDVSGGLPRGINHLARQLLVARAQGRIGRTGVLGWTAVILILAGAGGGYFYTTRQPAVTTEPVPSAQAEKPIAQAPGPVDILTTEEVKVDSVEEIATEPPPAPDPLPEPQQPVPAPEPEPMVIEAAPVVAESAPEPAASEPDVQTEAASLPIAPVEIPATPVAAAEPVASETGRVPGPADTGWRAGLRGPDWIRQQPEGTHFLQLINASDLGNARKMLRKMEEFHGELAAYTNYTPSGMPRYLILYGNYPDRSAAEAAIDQLPGKLRTIPPWPRARAGILRELDSAESSGLPP